MRKMAKSIKKMEKALDKMVMEETAMKDQLDQIRYKYEELLEEYAKECNKQDVQMARRFDSRYWGF